MDRGRQFKGRPKGQGRLLEVVAAICRRAPASQGSDRSRGAPPPPGPARPASTPHSDLWGAARALSEATATRACGSPAHTGRRGLGQGQSVGKTRRFAHLAVRLGRPKRRRKDGGLAVDQFAGRARLVRSRETVSPGNGGARSFDWPEAAPEGSSRARLRLRDVASSALTNATAMSERCGGWRWQGTSLVTRDWRFIRFSPPIGPPQNGPHGSRIYLGKGFGVFCRSRIGQGGGCFCVCSFAAMLPAGPSGAFVGRRLVARRLDSRGRLDPAPDQDRGASGGGRQEDGRCWWAMAAGCAKKTHSRRRPRSGPAAGMTDIDQVRPGRLDISASSGSRQVWCRRPQGKAGAPGTSGGRLGGGRGRIGRRAIGERPPGRGSEPNSSNSVTRSAD